MDAKVHPALPVHRWDAKEMIGPVHPVPRLTTAVESVGQVADPDVAVRRHRRNFRESFRVRVLDFHPWASVDAEPVGSLARQTFLAMQRLAASAGPEQVAPVVAEVVDHLAPILQGEEHPEVARPAVAKVRRAVVMAVVQLAS